MSTIESQCQNGENVKCHTFKNANAKFHTLHYLCPLFEQAEMNMEALCK